MDVKALLKRIENMDADAKAKAISSFVSESKRKTTIADERRATREKCFAECKKMTKAQQESLLWEFIAQNSTHINGWMHRNHPEIMEKNNASANANTDAGKE